MEKRDGSTFIGFLIGAIVGAAAAMLLTPASGTETRRKVKEQYSVAKDKTKQLAMERSQSIQQYAGRARETMRRTASQAEEQIPSPEQISGRKGGIATKININQASKEELMRVEGIGPVMADGIIAYRDQHGSFSDIDELKNITGASAFEAANLQDHFEV